jgi:16S rRNA G1207 methylase RsmC
MLQGPDAFLDVGTGVGWLAIEAARSWPALRVVDPWEPALTLARQNLAQRGVAERVELRSQRVEQLEEATTFTVAWLPGPFIVGEIADRALERVYCALVPGGWLVFRIQSTASWSTRGGARQLADRAQRRLSVDAQGG